jgi:hypothetical protein
MSYQPMNSFQPSTYNIQPQWQHGQQPFQFFASPQQPFTGAQPFVPKDSHQM